jgi:hypothetical protein
LMWNMCKYTSINSQDKWMVTLIWDVMGTVLKKAISGREAVYFLKIDHLVCSTKNLLICGSGVAVINFFTSHFGGFCS